MSALTRAKQFIQMARESETMSNAAKKIVRKEAKILAKKPLYTEFFTTYLMDSLPILHYAASQGLAFLCELLIDELEIGVDSTDKHGATALHFAVMEKRTVVVEKLLNLGADINARDSGGLTALVLSIRTANNLAMERLVVESSIDIETCFGRAVHAAAFSNNTRAVQACLQNGADKNHVINGFCNPLVAAIFGDSPSSVEFLLGEETHVNIKPLLYKAVSAANLSETDCLAMIKVLVGYGANANALDEDLDEDLPIICAAKRGRTRIVDFLLHVTNPIQEVTWTRDGLINHVNAEGFKNLDREKRERRINNLRPWMQDHLKERNFLAAEMFLLALKLDMDNEDWELYKSLCDLHIGSAVSCTYFDFSVDAFVYLDKSYLKCKQYHHAETAFKAALLLEPTNPIVLRYLNEAQRQQMLGSTTG